MDTPHMESLDPGLGSMSSQHQALVLIRSPTCPLVTSASLVVTSALLLGTKSY